MSAATASSGHWLQRLRERLAAMREARASRGPLPVRDWIDGGGSRARLTDVDFQLVWVVGCLLLFSVVMVYSASIALPDARRFGELGHTHFLVRQSFFVVLGLAAGLTAAQVPMHIWERYAKHILVISLVLLVLVLIPGVGRRINGAMRWLPMGVLNFQPSELAKLGMVMYAASYMVRKMDVKERFFKAVWPMSVALAVIGMLLLAEPDMGAFVVIAAIALGILFLGGVNGRMFLLSVAVLLGAFALMVAFEPYRLQRALAFTDPFAPEYAKTKGYQLTQSLIAFGRGELFGQGLGFSVEKLHYLPEAHTDFLLAVVGEELGFLGVFAVLCTYFWLTRRIFLIGRAAIGLGRVFAGLTAQGIGIWIGGQSLINLGVNLGALPTKGLTLPLMSYGGSAMILGLVAIAVVIRVDMENRQLMRGGRA